jgi:hypothetical protein
VAHRSWRFPRAGHRAGFGSDRATNGAPCLDLRRLPGAATAASACAGEQPPPNFECCPWFPLGFLSAFYEFPLIRSPYRRSPIAEVARQQQHMSGPIRLTALTTFRARLPALRRSPCLPAGVHDPQLSHNDPDRQAVSPG